MKSNLLYLVPLALLLSACGNGASNGSALLGGLGGLATGSVTLSPSEAASLDNALKEQIELKAVCEEKVRTMRRSSSVSTEDLTEGERKYGFATKDLDSLRSSLANDIRTSGINSVSESSRQAAQRYRTSAQDFIAHGDKALGTSTRSVKSFGVLLAGVQTVLGLWTNYEAQKRQAYASAVEARLAPVPWSSLS